MTYSPTSPLPARLRALREAIDKGKPMQQSIIDQSFTEARTVADQLTQEGFHNIDLTDDEVMEAINTNGFDCTIWQVRCFLK